MIAQSLRKALDHPIRDGIVRTFRTRKDAETAGKAYGWRCAIRLDRRFEKIWVVGKKDFQPTYIIGIAHDQYHFPLLRWEKDSSKIEYCPILNIEINQGGGGQYS